MPEGFLRARTVGGRVEPGDPLGRLLHEWRTCAVGATVRPGDFGLPFTCYS